MSYEKGEIEFSDGINIIVGRNGSGKSCIIDGIYITLLTLKNSGFKKEEIKNKWLNKEPYLELHIEHNGKEYGLKYENNQYYIKEGSIFKPFVQEKYKEFINENLIPEDIIKNALIIRQDDIKLLSLDRKTRIDTIKKFVGIEEVYDAFTILEKALREWSSELKLKNESVEDLQKMIDGDVENKLKEIEKKYNEINEKLAVLNDEEKNKKQKKIELENKIKELNNILNEFKIKRQKKEIIKKKIEKLQEKINSLKQDSICDDEYNLIKKELEKHNKKEKLKEKIITLEKEIEDIKKEIETISFDKEIFEKFEKIEKEYQIQMEILNLIKRLKSEMVDSYEEKLKRLKELENLKIEENLSLMKFQMEKLKKDLKDLDERERKIRENDQCPVCKNKLTEDIKKKLLSEILCERTRVMNQIEELKKKISEYEKLLKDYYELKKIERYLIRSEENSRKIEEIKKEVNSKILNEYSKLKARYLEEIKKREKHEVYIKKLEQKLKELESLKKEYDSILLNPKLCETNIFDVERKYNNYKMLNSFKKELENDLKELETIEHSIKVLEDRLKDCSNIDDLENEKRALEKELEGIIETKNELMKKYGEIESKINFLKEKIENQKEIKQKIEKLRSEIKELEILCEKCSKYTKELDAYYSYLKNEAIPEIVEIASEIFVRLTDYEFERLEYVEDKDKFDIVAIKKGERFDPKNLSGGQQTLYSLALRFAIGIWSKKNSGLEKIDCIILDEPTIHLDDNAIERLKNEIENLGIEQMIIVTHDQIFPKIADKIFRVTIDKGFSNIKEEKEVN